MIIDISRYNRVIDFKKVKLAGVTEAISRIGVGFNGDPFFGRNWRRAGDQGLICGAYYVPKWGYDVMLQVECCAAALDGVGWDHDGEVWLDCEVADGFSQAELRVRIQAFVTALEKYILVRPGIYTARWWWDPHVGNVPWAKYHKLWVANYTGAPKPLMPMGWTSWLLWQYSETGLVDGCPGRTDLNRRAIPF